MSYNLLKGKRGIIFGALNEQSIAWKVAEKAVEEGASITLSNTPVAVRMGEVSALAEKLNCEVIPADATSVEDLENVFKRFYTINKGDESESNGIGLSLTKDLVELHHGTINVESELGKGSTFTVDLPINKDSYQEDELISEHISVNGINTDLILEKEELIDSKVGEGEDMQIADVHLLLVEDNEELLFLMEKILSKHYHVLIAKDGLEALNVIKDNEIDIIISDVMMPEMSGKELCYKIKTNVELSHISVVLLTAQTSVEYVVEGLMFGADDYVTKPFNVKVLIARCNNLIKNKKRLIAHYAGKTITESPVTEAINERDKELLAKCVNIIKENFENPAFDVTALASELCVGRSKLYAIQTNDRINSE